MNIENASESKLTKRRFGCLHVLLIVLVMMLITAGITFWWVKRHLYAQSLEPVKLSQMEKETLDDKVKQLEEVADGKLTPEKFDEKEGKREIELSERELNYLIAKDDPATAEQIAVDLADGLVSLKMVMPVDEEAPILGGKKIRLKVGLNVDFDSDPPEISLRGVSLGGISLPNAWLGNLKNQNLIEKFEKGDGISEVLAGVESIKVMEGKVMIVLKE